jgi:hypothetical protein
MYTVRNGEDLQRGDLIVVCGCNYLELGIYYGRGKSGTVQYYTIQSAHSCEYRHNERVKSLGAEKVGPFKLNHIWKSYVNSPSAWRFMKLYKNNITNIEDLTSIEESKKVLEQFGITVNY